MGTGLCNCIIPGLESFLESICLNKYGVSLLWREKDEGIDKGNTFDLTVSGYI